MRLTLLRCAARSSSRAGARFAGGSSSFAKLIEKYAEYNPVTLTLKDFVDFGKNSSSIYQFKMLGYINTTV